MMVLGTRFYNGPWKWFSVLFVAAVAITGFFWPLVGLVVPVMILVGLVTNLFGRRSFCAGLCPNGRSLSFAFSRITRNEALDKDFRSPMLRRALCAFALFCAVNLLVRSGGELALVGRAFWLVYTMSVGLSAVLAIAYKPRSWCAVCPMGTLQDTIRFR